MDVVAGVGPAEGDVTVGGEDADGISAGGGGVELSTGDGDGHAGSDGFGVSAVGGDGEFAAVEGDGAGLEGFHTIIVAADQADVATVLGVVAHIDA